MSLMCSISCSERVLPFGSVIVFLVEFLMQPLLDLLDQILRRRIVVLWFAHCPQPLPVQSSPHELASRPPQWSHTYLLTQEFHFQGGPAIRTEPVFHPEDNLSCVLNSEENPRVGHGGWLIGQPYPHFLS